MFVEIVNWIVTFIAILGAYLVSCYDKRGFYLWIISNTFFMFSSIFNGQYALAFLFFVYLCITFNGVIRN